MPPMGLSWLPMTQPRIPHGPTGTPRGAPVAPHGTFMAPHEAPVDFSIAVLGNAMAHMSHPCALLQEQKNVIKP